jgi:hypothetical protein
MSRRGDTRTLATIVIVVAVVSALLAVVRLRTRAELERSRAARAEAGATAEGIACEIDPTATGGIDGTVIDASGALGPGVTVAVRGERCHRAIVVDPHGSFVVRGLPVGKYVVSASTPEGAAGSATSEVVANRNAAVTLRLSLMPGTVSVSGHVHDILGGPVAAAEVWIGGDKEGLTVIVRTGQEGDFAARADPGKHELRVRALGYAEAAAEIVLVGDLVVDLVVHPASILRGVVVLADGKGAPAARVRARHGLLALDRTTTEATTNGDGRFEMRDLPPGQYDLDATTSTESGAVRGVNLAPADTRDVRIRLAAASFVTGRVRSASGQVLAGATVHLRDDTAFEEEATSGADGKYRMPGISPGLIDLRACAPGYACAVAEQRVAAVGDTTIDVTLHPGASLRLRAVDKDGKSVRDAHIHLSDWSHCDTGADGECVIDNASPRKTKVTVEHLTAGYAEQEITIAKGETQRVIRLVPGATLRGTVHWNDGKPAAGVHVFEYDVLARTRADGHYELANVRPGLVCLRAAAAMDLGERMLEQRYGIDHPDEVTVELLAGEVHENVDLVVPRRSKHISGLVVGPDGLPVPYARVGLAHEDPRAPWVAEHAGTGSVGNTAATYSGADGTFTIEGVSEGRYVVWADADEQPVGRTRDVVAGSEQVTVELPPAAVIEGDVKDEADAPVLTFIVHAGDSLIGSKARISGGGHFVIAGLAAGHYSVTVETYSTAGAGDGVMIGELPDFELSAGEHRLVAVVVHAPLTVTGRIVAWPDLTPRGGVELSTGAPLWRTAAPTTEDGSFRLEGVSPGAIEVSSFDVDGEPDEWTREVAMGPGVVDIGDLAFAPGKHGSGTFQFDVDGKRALIVNAFWRSLRSLGLQKGDEIVSFDGHPVATLGASSLCGLMQDLTPDVPIVVRKSGATELTTQHLPVPPAKPAPGR